MDAEGLGDGGTGDVGVQHAYGIATAAHGDGQLAGDHGLTHAALAGHDAVDLAHPGVGIMLLQQGLGLLPLPAALAAGGAVMGTFAHSSDISLFYILIDIFTLYTPKDILYLYRSAVNRWTETSLSPAKKAASRL